jgi:hypothetical protein
MRILDILIAFLAGLAAFFGLYKAGKIQGSSEERARQKQNDLEHENEMFKKAAKISSDVKSMPDSDIINDILQK